MDVWVIVEITQVWDPGLNEWVNTGKVEIGSIHTNEENAKFWASPGKIGANIRILKTVHKSYIMGV